LMCFRSIQRLSQSSDRHASCNLRPWVSFIAAPALARSSCISCGETSSGT
jgi:hypothetical protein